MYHEEYRKKNSLEKRINETKYIKEKYPNHVPILLSCSNDIFIEKHKYIIPSSLSITEFLFIIRKRMHPKLENGEALFCFIGENDIIPRYSASIGEYYLKEKYIDNYLLLRIQKENTFGDSK